MTGIRRDAGLNYTLPDAGLRLASQAPQNRLAKNRMGASKPALPGDVFRHGMRHYSTHYLISAGPLKLRRHSRGLTPKRVLKLCRNETGE